ncbi:MAG: metal-dependent transcriptional regulator [Anaerolineae bacterium]|nr:metal-dependent transcriptional regulator [Anaerolineae bacterium]
MITLSQSTEDYLEAMLIISLERGVVRVKDLAAHLQVKAPSVVATTKRLVREGLVRHERYGYLELTAQGLQIAQEIYTRHKNLFRFLHLFLGVDEKTAERDACQMEHHISPETMGRIVQFLEFIEACPAEESHWIAAFRQFTATGTLPTYCTSPHGEASAYTRTSHTQGDTAMPPKTLADLPAGQQAEVARVGGEMALKSRLLEMGIVPGTKITVERVAPLGDPVEVTVRGYRLSLRREEAAVIVIKER